MCRYATRKNGLNYDDLPYALIGQKLADTLLGKHALANFSNFQGPYVRKGGNYIANNCEGDTSMMFTCFVLRLNHAECTK